MITTGGVEQASSPQRKRKTPPPFPRRARSIPRTSHSCGSTETCRFCAPTILSESMNWASEARGVCSRTRALNHWDSSPYLSSHSALRALVENVHSRESMRRESQYLESALKHSRWNAPLLRVGFRAMNQIGSPSVPPFRNLVCFRGVCRPLPKHVKRGRLLRMLVGEFLRSSAAFRRLGVVFRS